MSEPVSALPLGTVTFLLTDVEGSTRMWERGPCAAGLALARHAAIVDEVVREHGGARPEEQGEGDSAVVVFGSAAAAVAAAVALQRRLRAEPWSADADVRVRIGLHSGEAQLRDGRHYTGPAIHRCARLRDIAHGGQTVVSSVTAGLVAAALPDGAWLVDAGVHRLRDLSQPERVFELRHTDVDDTFPQLRSLDILPNNLPAQVTTFVGRTDAVAEVAGLLEERRLVCLTGAGGCGKTRLALQVAAATDRFPDGVWWVDLSTVTRGEQVAELAASAVGALVDPRRGPLQALTQSLRNSRVLLCLDNCEHVVDDAAAAVTTLLRTCPLVSVLTTSREPLGVPGETVWRVPSLPADEASALFVDRAAAARPGFSLDPAAERHVATICERLDGIPLAVELAAAWVRALSPAEIAAGLGDRFRLLTGGRRGVVARQQTLLGSIQWSHDLLDDEERALFRRLSVFAGGWTLGSAEAVCGAPPVDRDRVLEVLARLVDKSLVIVEQSGDAARYRLLETVRQYARDRLDDAGETEEVHDRHLCYFSALAQTADPLLEEVEQDRWFAVLESEHDNFRVALEWAFGCVDREAGRRLAASLAVFWAQHGHHRDGAEWLERAIAAGDGRSELDAVLHSRAAFLYGLSARLAESLDRAAIGQELATALGDKRSCAWATATQAYAQLYFDLDACDALAKRAEELARAGRAALVADAAVGLQGMVLANRGQHEAAAAVFRSCLASARRRGDRFATTTALVGETFAALVSGDLATAQARSREGLDIATPLGDFFTVGMITCWATWALALGGDLPGARLTIQPLARAVDVADARNTVPLLALTMGRLALWDGDLDGAEPWLEQATRWGEPLVDNLAVCWALPSLGALLRRRGALDEASTVLERAVELSQRLGLPLPLTEALTELARTVIATDPGRAEDRLHEALTLRVKLGHRTFYVDSLEGLALAAERAGSHREAARLLGAAHAGRQLLDYARFPVDVPGHEASLAGLREALGDEAFELAWAEGVSLDLDAAVSYARRARGERQRPSTGWESLTPTEHEVIGLVAAGHTNPEIAAQLLMSRSTVKAHLSHVYGKLGIGSRAELAARVAERREA